MTELSSTNRSKTSYVREITAGVTPTNPVFKTMRVTSNTLKADPQTVTSDEIRADRQVADLILVGLKPAGDIGQEASFEAQGDAIEEALQGTWANKPSIIVAAVDTEISDVAATTLTVASGGASFVAGMLTLTSGFTTAANNRLARVVSSTSTSIVYPATSFTAEGSPIPVGAAVRTIGFEGASGDLVATTTGGNALTSTVLDFTTLGLNVGEWVRLGDGDNAGNAFATASANGWARISAVAAHRLSFDIAPVGFTGDTGTSKAIRVFTGDFIANGVTKRYRTIERQQLDTASPVYEYFRGCLLSKLSWNIEQQKVVTAVASFVAFSWAQGASRPAGVSDIAAPTYSVLNASTNVGRLGMGGAPITGPNFVQKISIDIDNNAQGQSAVGAVGYVGIYTGEFKVSGSLTTYFGDASMLQAAYDNTISSADFRVGRADGNRETILLDIPKLKFTTTDSPVSGKNQSRMVTGGFQGLVNANGYTISFARFWYLPVVNA